EARAQGFETEILRSEARDKKPRPNLIIKMDCGADENLIIVTHLDVVLLKEEWKRKPNKMRKEGEKIMGLGVADDKGAIAVAMGAMKDLKGNACGKNIILIVSCDEEIGGGHGIKFIAEQHGNRFDPKNCSCLVMDSFLNYIGIGCSGVVRGKINFKSIGGHAAYPFRHPNIVHKVVPFLNDLKEYEKKREKAVSQVDAPEFAPHKKVWGRFNITVVRSGVKSNVIPAGFAIGFDIRALPEEKIKKVMNEFRRFAKKLMKKHGLKGRITLTGTEGYFVPTDSPFVIEFTQSVKKVFRKEIGLAADLGGTDGRFIARIGIPTVSFGPGGENQHTPNESITIDELTKSKKMLMEFCRATQ
ncbi:MAG: M20/M25/M40 family metallo-hydrolase, partial [Candidatus Diapherotrites archaeon]